MKNAGREADSSRHREKKGSSNKTEEVHYLRRRWQGPQNLKPEVRPVTSS